MEVGEIYVPDLASCLKEKALQGFNFKGL